MLRSSCSFIELKNVMIEKGERVPPCIHTVHTSAGNAIYHAIVIESALGFVVEKYFYIPFSSPEVEIKLNCVEYSIQI